MDAKCPDLVRDRLYQAWATGAPAYGAHRDGAAVGAATAVDGGADAEEWQARYEVIRDVMADPDASMASESMDTIDLATHGQDPTLAETLWRFIVLFGLPTRDGLGELVFNVDAGVIRSHPPSSPQPNLSHLTSTRLNAPQPR